MQRFTIIGGIHKCWDPSMGYKQCHQHTSTYKILAQYHIPPNINMRNDGIKHMAKIAHRPCEETTKIFNREHTHAQTHTCSHPYILYLFIMKVNLYNPFSFWLISIRSNKIFINSFLLYMLYMCVLCVLYMRCIVTILCSL